MDYELATRLSNHIAENYQTYLSVLGGAAMVGIVLLGLREEGREGRETSSDLENTASE